LKHDQRFVWLDFIRGACAIAVCAGHLRSVAIANYADAGVTSVLQKLFYVSTGLGHQAVMVFFVLSGFFVGGAALQNRQQFDPARYITARLTRLWIVLIPALLLTALLDFALMSFNPGVLDGAYRSLWNSGPGGDQIYSGSLATFISNVFFLQTITAPVFGTNGPLWSLSNEFWYYALFPIILLAAHGYINGKKITNINRFLLVICGCFLIHWLPIGIMEGFLIWSLGLVVYVSQGKIQQKWNTALLFISTLIFATALGYSKSESLQRFVGLSQDFVVAGAFCVLAIAIVNRKPGITLNIWFSDAAKLTSDFSFSLYLVHFPIVAIIGGTFYQKTKLQPDLLGMLHYCFWLSFLLLCGYVFYTAFEKRTNVFRLWVQKTLVRLK
jgi:peptidoglycan/LPS O-acetylase OafA/YrhL